MKSVKKLVILSVLAIANFSGFGIDVSRFQQMYGAVVSQCLGGNAHNTGHFTDGIILFHRNLRE